MGVLILTKIENDQLIKEAIGSKISKSNYRSPN